MRLSLRKVVKYSTFLFLFLSFNILISYNVNFWGFTDSQDRGKVEKSLVVERGRRHDDNGGAWPSPPVDEPLTQSVAPGAVKNFRKQRSAKSIVSDDAPNLAQPSYVGSRSRSRIKSGSFDKGSPVASDVETNLLNLPEFRIHGGNPKLTKENKVERQGENLNGLQKVNIFSKDSSNGPDESAKNSVNGATELKDLFISVKTTSKYHESRIHLILKTWYLLARDQTYFFTDASDQNITEVLGDHLINTNCSTDHSRRALSCKMAVEFDHYMASRKRWFCHVDDDVYLNVPRLVQLLREYDYREDWYLGKPSLRHPLEVTDRENPGMKLTFWFATGGAGFCISRSLALKMGPYASGGRFMTTAEKIRLPDDCTLGYIIEYLLKKRLTIVEEFHSHLEALWLIKPHQMKKQITLSFSEYSGKKNMINIPGFTNEEDPTRLKSLHCFLFSTFRECRSLS